MKKRFVQKAIVWAAIAAVAVLAGCNNLIHDLIPPSDNDILAFRVSDAQGADVTVASDIGRNTVTVTVSPQADVSELYAHIQMSPKSTILPFTIEYIHRTFPSADLLQTSVQMYEARKNGTLMPWVIDYIQKHGDFTVPDLSTPIDFSADVSFGVIAGDGSYRAYSVGVKKAGGQAVDGGNAEPSGAEKRIIEFSVDGQLEDAQIDDGTREVSFVMGAEQDVTALVPRITVSQGATVLPMTADYLGDVLSFEQMLSFYSGFSSSANPERFVEKFIAKNGVEFPAELNRAMDFTDPVYCIVRAQDGTVAFYKITCATRDTTPRLTSVGFTKFHNQALLADVACDIHGTDVTATATYPYDYATDNAGNADALCLVPEVAFTGDRVTFSMEEDGEQTELTSGMTALPFDRWSRTVYLHVHLGSSTATYALTVGYAEDPDTIRSITDFRFVKGLNADIQATAMASIVNEGDTGLITVTVLYSGSAAPEVLVPTFITPGSVTVEHERQYSGVTGQDFGKAVRYLCTSKNGMFSRLYTVRVRFVRVEPAVAALTSFTLPAYLNAALSCDAEGVINDSTETVFIEAKYHTPTPPAALVSEFSATGPVTVGGATQSPGYSAQDFTRAVRYTVRSGEDPAVTKTYKVQVTFVYDTQSACSLDSLAFLAADNATLESDVTAIVSQNTLTGYAFLPYGTGSAATPLVPTFTASGTVTVDGATQISGASCVDFSAPVTYTVTSANGLYTKRYVVSLQESGSVIYVDSMAIGRNNGTSWQDAYTTLDGALQQAAAMPDQTVAEIWLCDRGTAYEPCATPADGFALRGNLILRGGFAGTELNASDRLGSRRTGITHSRKDAGDYKIFYDTTRTMQGTLVWDSLELDADDGLGWNWPVQLYTDGCSLEMENVVLSCKRAQVSGLTGATVRDSTISGAATNGGLSLSGDGTGNASLSGIHGTSSVAHCSGFDEIHAERCTGDGSYFLYANTRAVLTDVTADHLTVDGEVMEFSNCTVRGGSLYSFIRNGNVSKIHMQDCAFTERFSARQRITQFTAERCVLRDVGTFYVPEDGTSAFAFTDGCDVEGNIVLRPVNSRMVNTIRKDPVGFEMRDSAFSASGTAVETYAPMDLTVRNCRITYTGSGTLNYGIRFVRQYVGAFSGDNSVDVDGLTMTAVGTPLYGGIVGTNDMYEQDNERFNGGFSQISVTNSSFDNVKQYGVALYSGRSASPAHAEVTGCRFDSANESTVVADNAIVFVSVTATDTCTVTDNTFTSKGLPGGYVELNANVTRTFERNTNEKDVYLKLSGAASNTFTGREFAGVSIAGDGTLAMSGCTINGGLNSPALRVFGTNALLTQCTVKNGTYVSGLLRLVDCDMYGLLFGGSARGINSSVGISGYYASWATGSLIADNSRFYGSMNNIHGQDTSVTGCDFKNSAYVEYFGGDMTNCTFDTTARCIRDSWGTFDTIKGRTDSAMTMTFTNGGSTGATVRNTHFKGVSDARAIYAPCQLTVENCSFTDCSNSWNGGAVYGSGLSSTFKSVAFINCRGISSTNEVDGGALYVYGGTAALTDCTFDNCRIEAAAGATGAKGWGGAISMSTASSTITLTRCTFTNCSTLNGGGGLYSNSPVTATDTRFTGCSAPWGGGIQIANTTSMSMLTSCTFDSCSAGDDNNGGAILASSVPLTINGSGTSFKNCRAGYGGAIKQNSGSKLLVTAGTFTDCRATYGGAIHSGSDTHIENATFTKCGVSSTNNAESDGGAVYIWDGTARISKSVFTECTAGNENSLGWGGAINFNGTSIVCFVEDCSFTRCGATMNGGAIKSNAKQMDIRRCTFIENVCAQSGAAISAGIGSWTDEPARAYSITQCKFRNNSSTGTGYAHDVCCIVYDGGRTDVTGSTLTLIGNESINASADLLRVTTSAFSLPNEETIRRVSAFSF